MKKKATSKVTRKSPKKTGSSSPTVLIHRIFIVTTCIVLFAGVGLFITKPNASQSVLGATVMKGMYDEATVGVPNDFPDAASYTIYYKLAEEKDFNNSVTNIAPGTKSYTIAYLKRDGKYQYRYAAVDAEGKEFVFSEILPLSGLRPM